MKVFISHDEKNDHRLAHSLAGLLLESGMEPLIASQRRQPGKAIDEKIREMIEESDCVVVFVTYYGNRNQWVQQEIGLAKALDKHIVPVTTRGVRPVGALGNLTEYLRIKRKDPSYGYAILITALKAYAADNGIEVGKPRSDDAASEFTIIHLTSAHRCPQCGNIDIHVGLCHLCGDWVCLPCGETIPPTARV